MSALSLVDVGFAQDDDAQIIRGHLDGDPGSFDVLYRRYFPRLVRMLARRIGDTPAAEDIAQETLLRALNNLHRFDLDRPMWPWLKTIATNLSADHLRRRGREPIADIDTTEGTTGEEATAAPADDLVTAIEDRRVLALALEQVPARQRIALGLRYLDDWSPEEAADFLGVTRNGFDQLLFRARARLRAEYEALTGELSAATRMSLLPLMPTLHALRQVVARMRSRTTGIEAQFPGVATSSELLVQAFAAAGLAIVVGVGAFGIPASASADSRPAETSAPTAQQLRDEAVWFEAAGAATAGRARVAAAPAVAFSDDDLAPRAPRAPGTAVVAADDPAAPTETSVAPPPASEREPVADLSTDGIAPGTPRTRARVEVGPDEDGNQTLNSRLESRLGEYAENDATATVRCDGSWGEFACETYDDADEALPETPEPPPITDVTGDPEL